MPYEQKSKYLLSVIVPVYNAEKYLKECLDSIINQTLKGIQIIIVNDGSTDGSAKIIENYNKIHRNIGVVNHHKNEGVISARINGYKAATGKYIGWVDADDFLDKEMYIKMMQAAVNNASEIVICNYSFYPEQSQNKAKWYKEYKGKVDAEFVNRNTIQWNKIVDRRLLDSIDIIKLFNEVGEASYYFVLMNTNKISTIEENLYFYRVGNLSLSTSYSNTKWFEDGVLKSLNLIKYVKNTKYQDKWLEYFYYHYYYSLLITLIVCALNVDKFKYKKYQKIIKTSIYKNNKYITQLLRAENGYLRYFTLRYIIPNSYILASLIAKFRLKNSKQQIDALKTNKVTNIQVLVATMNRSNDELRKLVKSMRLKNSVIINQITKAQQVPDNSFYSNSKLVSVKDQGLSRSRNLAISNSTADICVIADDDMYYVDDYDEIVSEAYDKYPQADVIAFHVVSLDGVHNRKILREGKVTKIISMKLCSVQLTFRRKSIIDSGIQFDDRFGAGSEQYYGEENIFLYDCYKKKLKIYYIPIKIATLLPNSKSTWFRGHTKENYIIGGAVYCRMTHVLWPLFIAQFAIRKRSMYKKYISTFNVVLSMLKGAYSEIYKHRS